MTTATTPRTKSTRKVDLPGKVDQLGVLNAQIAALSKEADAIKAALKASGNKEVSGRLYRAVISTSTRTTLDSEKVKAILTPQQIIDCSKTSSSTTLTVYGL